MEKRLMPWNPERYMKTEEVIKILEENKITNVQPSGTIQNKLKAYIDLLDADRYV